MIRLSLLAVVLLGLAVQAFRDWYVSLCGLIAVMAVMQHPDMPKTLFGVQGLNPWNLLLLAVLAGWLGSRRRERLVWDMPGWINLLLLGYLAVVVVGFARLAVDSEALEEGTAYAVSEYLVNTVKWVVPGLLLYDGCRSRRRFVLGLAAAGTIYLGLGIQVIKWMPAGSILSGEELAARSSKILMNEVGYHRVNLSVLLAGASWAFLAARPLARTVATRALVGIAAISLVYAQALTAGRAGYGTWAAVGILLSLFRWRRYLLVIPILAAAVVAFVPAVRDRMLQGFSEESRDRNLYVEEQEPERDPDSPDAYTITAGRTLIWPYVIQKIGQAPLFGYGREAMRRTGLASFLWDELGESFPHPHNAYLQWLLDNGVVGFVVTMPFYIVTVVLSMSLFRDSRSPVFVAAGGAALSLVAALLIGSFGSQTFYPREGAVGMWAAIGLMLRVATERRRAVRLARSLRQEGRAQAPEGQAPGGAGDPVPPTPRPGRAPSVDALLWTGPR